MKVLNINHTHNSIKKITTIPKKKKPHNIPQVYESNS